MKRTFVNAAGETATFAPTDETYIVGQVTTSDGLEVTGPAEVVWKFLLAWAELHNAHELVLAA